MNKRSYINNAGYKVVRRPDHKKTNSEGYVLEHTLKAQQKIRREVKHNEVVHHKDGNKLNNKPSNLQVMTRSRHTTLHNKKKRY
jgi:hypothetical protein